MTNEERIAHLRQRIAETEPRIANKVKGLHKTESNGVEDTARTLEEDRERVERWKEELKQLTNL